VLRKGGMLVSLKNIDDSVAALKEIQAAYVLCRSDVSQLAEITRLTNAGKLKPHIRKVFPLSEIREALELSKQGHTRGKIVLDCL
jgi:NADPH:quinone reductase-like Zn-dependent oxidoreductase